MKMLDIPVLSLKNAILLQSGDAAGQLSLDGLFVRLIGSFLHGNWMKISGFPVLSE